MDSPSLSTDVRKIAKLGDKLGLAERRTRIARDFLQTNNVGAQDFQPRGQRGKAVRERFIDVPQI